MSPGGLLGTSLAYMQAGDIKPLYQIINEDMSNEQRAQLIGRIENAFRDLGPTDIAMLGALILQNSNMQEQAMKIAIDFVSTQVTGR